MGLKQDLIDAKVKALKDVGVEENVDIRPGSYIERDAEYTAQVIAEFISSVPFTITQLKAPVVVEKLKTSEQIELTIRSKNITEILKELRNFNFIIYARENIVNQITNKNDETINLIVEVKPENNAQEIIAKSVIEKGWGLVRLNSVPMTLEEIFMQVTTDEKPKE